MLRWIISFWVAIQFVIPFNPLIVLVLWALLDPTCDLTALVGLETDPRPRFPQ